MGTVGIICISVGGLILLFAVYIALAAYMTRKNYRFPPQIRSEEHRREHAANGTDVSYRDIPLESLPLTLPDGYKLTGELMRGDPERYVIVSHGYRSTRVRAMRQAALFRRLGFSVIVYDMRGLGDNERFPVSMGARESDDLAYLAGYVKKTYGAKILGLCGVSMGASVSVIAAAKTSSVDFVVSDCGYAGGEEMVKRILRQNRVPFASVVMCAVEIRNRAAGTDSLRGANALAAAARSKVPTLFLHGSGDLLVPCGDARRLYDASAAEKKALHVFDGATHCQSILQFDLYKEAVQSFLRDCGIDTVFDETV